MFVINIRGTNGSGKTTLARKLIGASPNPIDLVEYDAPTKRDPNRTAWVDGWGNGEFIAIGSYKQGCGGMDTIPSFALQQDAVMAAVRWTRYPSGKSLSGPRPQYVLCEGVLASTVAGSWLDFFCRLDGCEPIIAYLDTPIELCLERIHQRQIASGRGEREIKEDLVRNKVKAIDATRPKFEAAGIRTVTLRHLCADLDLMEAIRG